MVMFQSMKLQFAADARPARRELAALLDLWRAKAAAAPGGLPSRGDFDPLELKPWLPHLFITEWERASGRYRYRLIGTEIVATYGRDATGKYFDELYRPEHLAPFLSGYDWVREHGTPNCFTGTLFFVGRDHVQMEAVLLPLAMPADRDPQIAGAIYFSA